MLPLHIDKHTVLQGFMIAIAIIAETLDTGASVGICLSYCCLLMLLPNHKKITNLSTLGLLYTMPLMMLSQRNPLASSLIIISIFYWVVKYNKKILNTIETTKINAIIMSLPIMLLIIWQSHIEITLFLSQDNYNFQWVINLLISLGLAFALTIVILSQTQRTKMFIPIIIVIGYSLLHQFEPVKWIYHLPEPLISHKNTIGIIGTLCLGILLSELKLNPKSSSTKTKAPTLTLTLTLTLLCSLILIINPSRLGLFSTIILLNIYFLGIIKNSKLWTTKKIMMAILSIIISTGSIFTIENIRKSSFYKNFNTSQITKNYDLTTGRLKLWTISTQITENQLKGMGANHWVEHGQQKMIAYNGFIAENPHNGFIQTYTAYGVIGLLILICSIVVPTLKLTTDPIDKTLLLLSPTLPLMTESFSWTYGGGPLLSIWLAWIISKKILNTTQNS